MLPWLVGMKAAKAVLLTGDMIDAWSAWRMGFVTEVVPEIDLDDHVVSLASRLALISRDSMKLHKLAINRTYERQGMLAAIQDNYVMSTVANGTQAYRQLEADRQEMEFREFVRKRDQDFAGHQNVSPTREDLNDD